MSPYAAAHLGPRYYAQASPAGLNAAQEAVRERLLRIQQQEDWEETDCLCGAQGGRILTEIDRHGLPYRKVLCICCGLLRVTPRWTEARYVRFYRDDYRDLYSPLVTNAPPEQTLRRIAAGPGSSMVSEFVMSAWRQYGDYAVPNPAIVEIGAGGGWNLSRLPSTWTRIGYDTDERFLRLGRELFNVDLRRGFFEEALPAAAEADCVLLSHVLEHTSNPVALLHRLRDALKPSTLVLIEVPGIFRIHKTGIDPMRYWQNAHTYTFCARTLADTCRRAGLEPVAVDEWVRLVLRPSHLARCGAVENKAVATSLERYLRYCETIHRGVSAISRLPLIGPVMATALRRCGDACMRIMMSMHLIRGTRTDVFIGRED